MRVLSVVAVMGVVAASVPLSACHSPSAPWIEREVRGTVYDRGGQPVPHAQVAIQGRPVTFTDAAGEYRIRTLLAGKGILLDARDGFDPDRAYVVTCTGRAEVALETPRVIADIVLDACGPI